MNIKKTEDRTDRLPVGTDGKPVIVGCPATGCLELDPVVIEGAGGRVWITVCESGHLAFLMRKEDQV